MHSLFTASLGKTKTLNELSRGEKFSIYYHDLFDYPLTFADLIRWKSPDNIDSQKISVTGMNGYYLLRGRERLVYKRILRARISAQKMEIAKRASKVLSFVPGIKMVAVTGSLAMENSKEESDIDLMIITKKARLWTSRALVYLVMRLFNLQTRRFADKNQQDKLCLNMWIDESDITWKTSDRNFYTAHELAQITPLINKDLAYEKLLSKNSWILKYWPNAVRINKIKYNFKMSSSTNLFEKIAYNLQYSYMKNKITKEVVTPTRAFFHPEDWGRVIITRLGLDNSFKSHLQ
jgi:predicted nucleotidyltransferase